jgi:hypothetical protein
MGEYTESERTMNERSVYTGGRDGNMVLYFDEEGWIVVGEDGIGNGGFIMYANDSAITPDHIKAPWKVAKARQPAPSLRIRKLGGREPTLELSGIPSKHLVSYCMGRYTRQVCSHNDKPAYRGSGQADGMGIWFCEGAWRVGLKENMGTELCFVSVEECARTPDAVQSMWRAESLPELDKRVRVFGASAQQSSSATVHETQQLSSAPPKLAVIGSGIEGDSYDGIYTKQLCEVGSKVVYEGGGNGKQAIWRLQATWVVGDAENIGTGNNVMHTQSPAITPDAVTGPWRVPLMVPCTSIRVSKSKKKHTKVIEVKGVPDDDGKYMHDYLGVSLMNGKYRQSCMVGGRPMFKGGQDGRAALWFDERHGKWRGGSKDRIGTGICIMEATDSAAAPNAVKAPWYAHCSFKPSPYPNVIVPSVEAAEHEVPRLMQLKMSELVVAQHMRCLGCGHEYKAQAGVVFQMKCMHHHCVCCGAEHGGDVCAVCAEEGGK